MAVLDDAARLEKRIAAAGLFDPAQLRELAELRTRFPRAADLARELVRRGRLTPFQSGELLAGRADELVLGSYVLLEPIGEGGMGRVFKARHRVMDRVVAIKLIRPEYLENKAVISRFRRETRLAAKLHHPNVVLAHDALVEKGRHALVMEYVAGVTLAHLVREHGPLEPHRAADCGRQAALGLAHAHAQGLIHRDVKPENLLVVDGVVKVADLGVARLTPDRPAESFATEHGRVLGTVDYISPEQVTDSQPPTARSDLYSLGCTLYFLLTAQVPFPGGSVVEKFLRHRLEQPLPVPALRPGVPAGLCEVVTKLMAKDPADRYQSAADAAAALAKWCHPIAPTTAALDDSAPTAVLTPSIPPTGIEPPQDVAPSEPDRPRPKRRPLQTLFVVLAVLAALTFTTVWIVADRWAGRTGREPDSGNGKAPPTVPASWVVGPVLGPMPQEVADLVFAPDGRTIAVACGNRSDPLTTGVVALVELPDGKPVTLVTHRAACHRVAFTPNGDTLISVTGTHSDGKKLFGDIKFWDVRTRTEDTGRLVLDAVPASIQDVAVEREGGWFALGTRNNLLQIRPVVRRDGDTVRQFPFPFKNVPSAVALSSAARYIAGGSADGQAWVWRTDAPAQPVLHAPVPPESIAPVAGMHFLPNDEGVVWVTGTSLRKWDLRKWQDANMPPQTVADVTTISLGTGRVVRTALSPDGRTLATTWQDSPVRLFGVADGKLILELPGPIGSRAVAFSADGRTLAVDGPDRTVHTWGYVQP